jgi:hypothetical protein
MSSRSSSSSSSTAGFALSLAISGFLLRVDT